MILVDMIFGCFFGHKWEYGSEEIVYSSSVDINRKFKILQDTRYCTRCSKKQVSEVIGGGWRDWSLNKEESRDKKLKDLGI